MCELKNYYVFSQSKSVDASALSIFLFLECSSVEDTKSNVLVMFLIVENVAVSRLTREVKRNYLDNLNQLQVHNY